jgi:hypothetical protein
MIPNPINEKITNMLRSDKTLFISATLFDIHKSRSYVLEELFGSNESLNFAPKIE